MWEEEAALVVQHTVGFLQARSEKSQVVVEGVIVLAGADDVGLIAVSLETGAVAGVVAGRRECECGTGLCQY